MYKTKNDDKKEIVLDFLIRYFLDIKDSHSSLYKELYNIFNNSIEEYEVKNPDLKKELKISDTKIYYLKNKDAHKKIKKIKYESNKFDVFKSYVDFYTMFFIIEKNKESENRYNLIYISGKIEDKDTEKIKSIQSIGSFISEKEGINQTKILNGNVFLMGKTILMTQYLKLMQIMSI